MAKLSNAQIKDIVNAAYKQFTGKEDIVAPLDLTAFCDMGSESIGDNRERFTNALIGVITKNWFLDTSYRSQYNDIFYEDNERFGAIIQAISVEAPEAKDNEAWKDFESGVTKVGQYTVYLPIVSTKYYTKSSSWAIPITISWEQWDTAFHNETELTSFVNYVFMVVDNALVQHMEDMNDENRNNFISEKIAYSKKVDAKGVHVVDLVAEYVKEKGITSTYTRLQALNDREFLSFASAKMSEYIGYFRKQTALFNTEQKVRFTPEERLACQILSLFESKMTSVGYANTFHDEFIKLPNHQSVSWWQSAGDLSFDDVSRINIKNGNTTTEASGIVGLLCDKWAIVHTIRSNRVGSQNFGIENITHYEYQHRDSYINNLTMNAVVFTMNDHTVA